MLNEKDEALVQLLYDTFIKQTKLAVSGVIPSSNIEVSYMERHITSGAADATMNCETTMSYDIGYKAIYKKFNVRLVRDPSDSAIEFSIAWPPHREGFVVLSHFNFTFEMNDVIQALLNRLNSPEGKAEVTAIWSSTVKSSTIEIDPLKNFERTLMNFVKRF